MFVFFSLNIVECNRQVELLIFHLVSLKFEMVLPAKGKFLSSSFRHLHTHSSQSKRKYTLGQIVFVATWNLIGTNKVNAVHDPRPNLESVIWKILYPAIKEASLVSDCLPEPPTPTRRALPHGVRIIRDI